MFLLFIRIIINKIKNFYTLKGIGNRNIKSITLCILYNNDIFINNE